MPSTALSANILAGVSSAFVGDVSGFAAGQMVLLGTWGSETSEIIRVLSVSLTPLPPKINFSSPIVKAHAESTPITVLKYDQVRFYWTATDTYSATIPICAYTNLDPTSYFTTVMDTVHQSGYGWFTYYHSVSGLASSNSNAIPYANFAYGSVKRISDAFYSRLNQVQQRLIPWDDALMFLNEAYSLARAELNLINSDFVTSTEATISVVGGTQEYALPDRFSDLIYIRNSLTGNQVPRARIWEIPEWEKYGQGAVSYYIRGNWLGFTPTPTSDFTVSYRYAALPTFLNTYYDTVNLPDDNFWFLVDYMEYRAAPKLNRDGSAAFESWRRGIDLMKLVEARRGADPDAWRAVRSAWV